MFFTIALVAVVSALLFVDTLFCGFFQLRPLLSRVCQQWCQAMVSVFPALSGSPWPHNWSLYRLGSNTELTSSLVMRQQECLWCRSPQIWMLDRRLWLLLGFIKGLFSPRRINKESRNAGSVTANCCSTLYVGNPEAITTLWKRALPGHLYAAPFHCSQRSMTVVTLWSHRALLGRGKPAALHWRCYSLQPLPFCERPSQKGS